MDQGGGQVVEDQVKRNVNFIIECHGVIPSCITDSQITYVSTHWVRSCLEVCLKLPLWSLYAFFWLHIVHYVYLSNTVATATTAASFGFFFTLNHLASIFLLTKSSNWV